METLVRQYGSCPVDWLQWGHAFVSVETSGGSARRAFASMLQWGHAFVSVETGRPQDAPDRRRHASMGPRFCKRGNLVYRTLHDQVLGASMEPRFCKRGNEGWRSWRYSTYELQWGHAFVSVETFMPPIIPHSAARASMGPRFCKRGNFHASYHTTFCGACFNGATLL